MQETDLHYPVILDRASVICGASNTGKTIILKDMLYTLRPYVEQIIIISQTDKQNKTFSAAMVPSPLIHDSITSQLLDDIYERQEAHSATYNKIWENTEVIPHLIARISSSVASRAKSAIEEIKNKMRTEMGELSDEEKKYKQLECSTIINRIYVGLLDENKHQLERMNLDSDEEFALKYYKLNPRLIILFDDCTELIAKFKNHHVINKLFYQGRHSKITTLMACHTDKALLPEHKKNIFVTIFTDEQSAFCYFDKKSTALDPQSMAKSKAAIKTAFVPNLKYQKLMYIREERKFYKYTAKLHDNFKFGSPILNRFCEEIKAEEGSVSRTNRFANAFQ